MLLVGKQSILIRVPKLWAKGKCFDPSSWRTNRQVSTATLLSHKALTDPENIGVRQQGVNFDTLGSWNNRLELPILVEESIRKGIPIPKIPLHEVGCASLLGRRKHNEDRFIKTQLSENLLMFGVFDGHCGNLASDFTCLTISDHINFWLQRTSDLSVVLTNSFTDVNNALTRHLRFYHLNGEFFNSGTTATVCLLRNSSELVVGHVGDSRAVLCRSGKSIRLTTDHHPDDLTEAARVKEAGGTVITDSLGRSLVNGRLTMTRSIGDVELKAAGVTAVPQITQREIKHGKDAFMVLFTDGITFVMNDQELGDIVSACEVPSEAAVLITDQALQFGSDDNATAVVVPFGAWGKYQRSTASIPYSLGRNFSGSRYR